MSMDHVYEQLKRFESQFERFNEALTRTMEEMQARHDDVDGMWRDSFRKQYDERWRPLLDTIEFYRKHSRPQYERFLQDKIAHLHRYLFGH